MGKVWLGLGAKIMVEVKMITQIIDIYCHGNSKQHNIAVKKKSILVGIIMLHSLYFVCWKSEFEARNDVIPKFEAFQYKKS